MPYGESGTTAPPAVTIPYGHAAQQRRFLGRSGQAVSLGHGGADPGADRARRDGGELAGGAPPTRGFFFGQSRPGLDSFPPPPAPPPPALQTPALFPPPHRRPGTPVPPARATPFLH